MVINGHALLAAAPIKDMVPHKVTNGDVSYGLGEAGYDIRIKQEVSFKHGNHAPIIVRVWDDEANHSAEAGRFALASAIEEFQMPPHLMGIVHDKSTWARRGLSVFNTVIEPGWKGFLTLELVYHGNSELIIPAGSGIAQVVFHELACNSRYNGKYQNQEDQPVGPRKA
ncbi:dCTP deaminase [Stenotrophomonas phage Piffle]|uniref:dCTP deaminase n=1 Tax=Stenotrophomonas phage Piffle TaxID=2859656 RepID=A0AAE7WLZ8_9CAUD|nr:dCTP deaminase [Stenotrophomonas phage Piffle]QYW01890.1 dCTP deaminase [Stenotrophomonas phage Piffle]